jgi:putative ABC transport system ATP-binding protein
VTVFLEARGAGKRFHEGTDAEVRALEDVSLEVPRGGCVLVTGPSGGGKTTLLALLGTLERPTRGTVLAEGADAAGLTEAARSRLRRRIGFAFPGGAMVPRLPLWENVTLGLVPEGRGVAERRDLAAALLGRLGLGARIRAAAEELSTGEMQRAVLARALAAGPEALVVDEPLANLDDAARGLVLDALAEFHGRGGTILAASHAADALPFATARCRLEAGRRTDPPGFAPPPGRG